ncbi:MAG TPA: exo-beta-N-acetylmuramidase NamZ domain-containing protein [Candidatus Acidoferrales bacterium]|nr:exo-beta-N-acetylmuramidase NamZ domain-containing protein [Candidatus Acidoferrales bacterium]
MFTHNETPRGPRTTRQHSFAHAFAILFVLCVSASGFSGHAQTKNAQRTVAPAHPAAASDSRLRGLDDVINDAIARDEIPGAVLLVGQDGRVLWRKAYGSRTLIPRREAMTTDTIFDLASLTKIFATTASMMKLIEQGKIRLADTAVHFIPELGTEGATAEKNQITIRQLMTHTSGFAPDPDDSKIPAGWSGTEPLLKEIYAEPLTAPPGARFLYSDTNFILLGEIVHRVSGLPLNEFAAREIFAPLGMTHTQFLPPADWIPHIAPTEEIDLPAGAKAGSGQGHLLRGVVHDPRARQMGGVAGHAGLFSTADDLAIYCNTILRHGLAPSGKRIFSAAAIDLMTSPQQPPWIPSRRGLGWDIDSAYSAPRGDLLSIGSFGHTGFTGTSVWLDPGSGTFIILLTNSVHPYGRPAISGLRARVANVVTASLNIGVCLPLATWPPPPGCTQSTPLDRSGNAVFRPYGAAGISQATNLATLTGIDVLEDEKFLSLANKRIGLITNQTGIDRQGRSTIDVLAHAPGVKLVSLFSPEHGIRGTADENVNSTTDAATGLPINSLYGDTRRPTEQMLYGLDALVFDVQDAGVRFYTYITTMGYCMEEAAKRHIPFYVLDRPDILGGELVEGPILDRDKLNFVGYFPLPIRIGMTLGEMAQMFNAENHIGADLHVIQLRNWRRSQWFEQTGLPWIPPSPNLRSMTAAVPYPGIDILQSAGIAVGRGTETPFENFGAPYIDAVQFADYLNRRLIPGVRFVPYSFTPTAGVHKSEICHGVSLVITDRASLNSVYMGFEIAAALAKLYPQNFDLDKLITLVGNAHAIARLKNGDSPARILGDEDPELNAFLAIRAKYLLYR